MTKITNNKNQKYIQVGEITYFGERAGELAKVEPIFTECTPELDKEQAEFLQSAVDMFVTDLSAYCAKKEQAQANNQKHE